jgi:hypothetical protein
MNGGEHLTKEGIHKILSIRASMIRVLTEAFPNITPAERPKFEVPKNIDPY